MRTFTSIPGSVLCLSAVAFFCGCTSSRISHQPPTAGIATVKQDGASVSNDQTIAALSAPVPYEMEKARSAFPEKRQMLEAFQMRGGGGAPMLGCKAVSFSAGTGAPAKIGYAASAGTIAQQVTEFNTEGYDPVDENGFKNAADDPLSTFSIDVDKASYANVRRFITSGSLPPIDAVRIEEMINYFSYSYPQPSGDAPFSITTELGTCPWNTTHLLALVGIKGKNIATDNLPPGNLVFLLDVSGSMQSEDKLPLIQQAMKLLVENLRAQDHIAITVYAGAAGLVLPSTSGADKRIITEAIDRLSAGGSTAGSEGIELAYATAKKNFIPHGNNRVILATDGDFNVGPSSDAELVRLIEQKRSDGIFLTVLGFGTGNYKDSKMMKLADKGNGNYAYVDNLAEARKVLVSEMGGTLLTIARDVKIQVEFNPATVASYRLVGYEKRRLNNEDFNDDTKDAGELGSGHTVTALYEIVSVGSLEKLASVDPLKYQVRRASGETDELLTIKFRYKEPQGDQSKLIEQVLRNQSSPASSENFRFAAAVAGFGMLLRDSQYKGGLTFDAVRSLAQGAQGSDNGGYRAEFLSLVRQAEALKKGSM